MDQANGLGEPVPLRQRCFSEAGPDGVVHFQIVDLRRQLFVWVSVGSADLGNLCMATQTRMDNVPAVATLSHSSSNDAGNTLAQKLALRVRKPVLCSCQIPQAAPMLQAFAERRLFQELETMAV